MHYAPQRRQKLTLAISKAKNLNENRQKPAK